MRYRLALIRKILLNNELIRCNSLFWFILNKMSAASQRAVLRKNNISGVDKKMGSERYLDFMICFMNRRSGLVNTGKDNVQGHCCG